MLQKEEDAEHETEWKSEQGSVWIFYTVDVFVFFVNNFNRLGTYRIH